MSIVKTALTFDDVLLLPRYSEILPADVCLETKLTQNINLNIPLLSSAMDTVTESRLAIAMAEEGGMGIIHKNMTIEQQAKEVRKVKRFESGMVKDPITVTQETPLSELKRITQTHCISGLPVVEGGQLLGIITSRDIRFETDFTQPVSALMTPKERLITVHEQADREEVIQLFRQHRIEKLLIVDDDFKLKGMYTVKDLLREQQHPNACKSASGQLRVAAAIGVGATMEDRVAALVAAEVDVLVLDSAHGHSKNIIDKIRWLKQHYPDTPVIGGNIATEVAAKALIDAGVDAVKVGIGPGSICTTRIVSGVGVPQITAIMNVCNYAHKKNIPVIADGGIRFSGDIAKALAAGASAVMIGGLFAGTEEAPGEIVLYQGRSYKSYRGMGSVGAMTGSNGSSDRYFQVHCQEAIKYVPEGIEGRVPYKGALRAVVYQLMGGLRSSMGYTGTKTIKQLQTETEFVHLTNAGMRESHVHDVVVTKEAPNYSAEKIS